MSCVSRPPHQLLGVALRLLSLALSLTLGLAPQAAAAPKDKVEICHFPPGNPKNFQTITISANALPSHLAHGDFPGPCKNDCNLFGESICDDHNLCTYDSCNTATGACNPSVPINCNDGNACTTDSCNPSTGACENTPQVGKPCSDDNACTGADQCNASGQCGGTPIPGCCLKDADCNDDKVCTTDVCNLATKTCTNIAKNCEDGNACTVDACDPVSGACIHPPKDCDDHNPCTADSCDSSGACGHTPVALGTSCSDGVACNGVEMCNAVGVCQPGVAPNCDDHNPCTTDTCTAAGGCTHTPVANGTACDDHNVCTVTSTCFNGSCSQFTAQRCDSGWGLGDSSACDPATGCHTQCPAYFPQLNGQPDLCQPLDPEQTSAQGSCIYKAVFCQAEGCYFRSCNPNTGQCERENSQRNRVCDIDPCSVPPGGCDIPPSICTVSTCDLSRKDVPNCGTQVSATCSVPGICSGGGNAGQPCDVVKCTDPRFTASCPCEVDGGTCMPLNFCQTNRIDSDTNSLGCTEVDGCQYTGPHCAETKPLGEPGNCQEYFENPENPGCCELRPKVCRATDFGLPADTTGYTFSCEQATGKCVATPQ